MILFWLDKINKAWYTENNYDEEEKYDFDTKLIKATSHNGKISLYIQHYTEVDEYSGERSSYKGVYKNTYKSQSMPGFKQNTTR